MDAAGGETPEACDAHHHLYASGNVHSQGAPYLVPEFLADMASAPRVRKSIYVQAATHHRTDGPIELAPVGETEWITALTREHRDRIAAIIGFADLSLGRDVEPVLDAHLAACDGRFRGIRHSAAWDPHPDVPNSGMDPPEGLLRMDGFAEGVRVLGERGMVFETWIYHHQLGDLAALARACPGTPVVVNHLGGPIRIGPHAADPDRVTSEWRAGLAQVAACPNACLKLGGLGIRALTPDDAVAGPVTAQSLADHWGDDLRWCIDLFGPQRCMFESNFPPDARLCSYRTMWETYDLAVAGYSPEARRSLFGATATGLYGI